MLRPVLLFATCVMASPITAAELSLTYSSSEIELAEFIQSGGSVIIEPPSPFNLPPPAPGTMDELRFSYGIGRTTAIYLAQRQVSDLMTREYQFGGSLSEAEALALGVEMRGARRAGFAFIARAEVSNWDITQPNSFGSPVEASFTSIGVALGVEFLAADWIAIRLDYQQDLLERYMQYGLAFGVRLNLDTADVF